MMTTDEFRRRILSEMPDAVIDVRCLTDEGDHFEATIASTCFQGKSLLAQHRMVYAALGKAPDTHEEVFSKPCASVRKNMDPATDFGDTIHALALTTRAR